MLNNTLPCTAYFFDIPLSGAHLSASGLSGAMFSPSNPQGSGLSLCIGWGTLVHGVSARNLFLSPMEGLVRGRGDAVKVAVHCAASNQLGRGSFRPARFLI